MKKNNRNNTTTAVIEMVALVICIVICAILGVNVYKLHNKNNDLSKLNDKRNTQIESYKKSEEEHSSREEELMENIDEKESSYKELEDANKNLVKQVNVLKGEDTPEETTMSQSQYSELYPDMYVSEDDRKNDSKKIVYLTFDDGPSDLTPEYLKILKSYGVHATFFVTYQPQHKDLYKQEVSEGHKVQIHTATHDYNKIYQSVEAYMADFEQMYSYIYETTGQKPDCFRFPGGSTNSYGASTIKEIARELSRRGFTFFDWNVSVGDGNANATRTSIIEKIKAESEGRNTIVMLAHDSSSKQETLAALPEIIEYYQSNGYEFGIIDGSVDASVAQYIKY